MGTAVQHLEDASIGVVHEAVNQIAFADVILLNKIDLVTEEQLQHARDLVRCAGARLFAQCEAACTHGNAVVSLCSPT
jgi:G3E family GTPase